jgi:hypothetical protein
MRKHNTKYFNLPHNIRINDLSLIKVFMKNKLILLLFLAIFSATMFAQVPTSPPVATSASAITQTSFSANWNTDIDVSTTGYRLDVGTTPGGTNIINNSDVGNVLTFPVSGLSSGITYYYQVRAYNINGINFTNSNQISIITIPANPTATAATLISYNSFQANWNAVTGAASYQLDVSTDPAFGSFVAGYNSLSVSGTSSPVMGLLTNTVYYYQVRAVDVSGVSGNSNSINLTTIPVLTAPANTLSGVSIEPVFSWDWNGSGSVTFDFIIQDITAGSPAVTITGLTTINAAPLYSHQLLETELSLVNNHEYSWQIRANQTVVATSTASTFMTSLSAAAVPSAPVNGSTVYSYAPVVYAWSVGSTVGPITFEVQYLQNSNLIAGHSSPQAADWAAGTRVTTTPTSSQSINTETLIAGTEYWWRVISLRGSDIISYSSANGQSFTTSGGTLASQAIPSWPVGTVPGPTLYTNAPTLSWYINSGDLTGITFEVKVTTTSDPNFLSPLVDATVSTLYYNVLPNTLAPATTYLWEIITHGTGTVTTVTSATESFTTNGIGTVLLPVLSYPTGGVILYTQSPTFFWFLNAATSGITYQVYIDGVLNGSVTDLYSYTTPSTLATGSHTWYINATNGNSAQDQTTATATFNIAGGITQGLPVVSWPVGNAIVYTQTPTLSWYVNGSTLGLTSYVTAWSTSNLGPAGAWQSLPQTPGTSGTASVSTSTYSYTLTNPQALNYGQTYFWAVASFDGNNYSTWSIDQFTVTGVGGSPVPIASYPINDEPVYSTSLTLLWYVLGPTTVIDHYRVIYSTRADMDQSDVVNTFEVDVPAPAQSLNLTNLVSGSTYYWEVGSSSNSSEPTAYSTQESFVVVPTTDQSVVVPLVGGPKNGVGLTTGSADFSWVIPAKVSDTLTYQLQFSNNSDMSDSTVISGIKSPSQIVNSLVSNKVYYWRVRSVNVKGQTSAYSSIGQFSVKSVTAVSKNGGNIPKTFAVSQNYPNPFNPSTVINYALPKSSLVTIKIYNVLGQEVKTLVNSQLQAGNYMVQWNGDNNFGHTVSSGVYIYRVVAGEYVKTMKMMLLK